MTRLQTAFLGALCAMVVGCAYRGPPPMSEADAAELAVPLTCTGADECQKLWRRAQVWVIQNSGYKIQIATDAVVETFNPRDYSLVWGFSLTRMPGNGNEETIELTPTC